MKILHITYGFQIGGIETMLCNIANEQARLGHRIYLLVIDKDVNEELKEKLDKNVRFICLGRKPGSKSIMSVLKLNIAIRSIKPDIVHIHHSSIIRFIIDPFGMLKICFTFHNLCMPGDIKYLYKYKHIYAISDAVRTNIRTCTGLESEVVYNGINSENIKTKKSKPRHATCKIVQISRLDHNTKGQHILITAIDILIKKGYDKIHVDFIGDGNSFYYLEAMVKELKLETYISFLGLKKQTYIFDHLCKYDLFIQPSIYEGFGLTVAEAMAAKVPVIVSDIDGPMELIGYGQYGCYFKSGDADDCAEKIELFLNGNYEPEKIESAYRKVQQCYDVKITSAKYIEKYRTIINNASSRS